MAVREGVGVSDNNNVEGGCKAKKKGPAKAAGRVLEPMRVDQNAFIEARVDKQVVNVMELVRGRFVRVLGPNGVEELLGEVGRAGFADWEDVRLEKSWRDAGQWAALDVVEANEEFHVQFFCNAGEQGFWELKGMGSLRVKRLVHKRD